MLLAYDLYFLGPTWKSHLHFWYRPLVCTVKVVEDVIPEHTRDCWNHHFLERKMIQLSLGFHLEHHTICTRLPVYNSLVSGNPRRAWRQQCWNWNCILSLGPGLGAKVRHITWHHSPERNEQTFQEGAVPLRLEPNEANHWENDQEELLPL